MKVACAFLVAVLALTSAEARVRKVYAKTEVLKKHNVALSRPKLKQYDDTLCAFNDQVA